jgi:hypothetical protein
MYLCDIQVLNRHPLFTASTQKDVLQQIQAFHENIHLWRDKARQNKELYDDNIWELIVQLLQTDPKKRMDIEEAQRYLQQNFPTEILNP